MPPKSFQFQQRFMEVILKKGTSSQEKSKRLPSNLKESKIDYCKLSCSKYTFSPILFLIIYDRPSMIKTDKSLSSPWKRKDTKPENQSLLRVMMEMPYT